MQPLERYTAWEDFHLLRVESGQIITTEGRVGSNTCLLRANKKREEEEEEEAVFLKDDAAATKTVECSKVVILIGSRPDLSIFEVHDRLHSQHAFFCDSGENKGRAGVRGRATLPPEPLPPLPKEDGSLPSHPRFLDVNPYSLQIQINGSSSRSKGGIAGTEPAAHVTASAEEGIYSIYAAGSVRGDNFVRFLIGDAWAIASHLLRSSEVLGK